MTKEDDIATMTMFMRQIKRFKWWSPRWLWWWLMEAPKPPSVYGKGEASANQDTLRVQAQRWLDKEP